MMSLLRLDLLSDKHGVKGIIEMHRFNICLVVVLLWCEHTISLDKLFCCFDYFVLFCLRFVDLHLFLKSHEKYFDRFDKKRELRCVFVEAKRHF